MFQEKFAEIIEAVDASEDKKVIKEFSQLLNRAYSYGDKNFKSDWAHDTVLYTLDEVRDYTTKLKGK